MSQAKNENTSSRSLVIKASFRSKTCEKLIRINEQAHFISTRLPSRLEHRQTSTTFNLTSTAFGCHRKLIMIFNDTICSNKIMQVVFCSFFMKIWPFSVYLSTALIFLCPLASYMFPLCINIYTKYLFFLIVHAETKRSNILMSPFDNLIRDLLCRNRLVAYIVTSLKMNTYLLPTRIKYYVIWAGAGGGEVGGIYNNINLATK